MLQIGYLYKVDKVNQPFVNTMFHNDRQITGRLTQ